MNYTTIDNLPVLPENYKKEVLENVDWSKIESQMLSCERAFVNGLIRFYKPKNVIEVGVAQGGGSVTILNAIMDLHESTLTSIDLLESILNENGESRSVGEDVYRVFDPHLIPGRWNLITGKDPSEVMGMLQKNFDFMVLDTAHVHPIESLNFLSVLPYLNDGAIVVLHDTMLHFQKGFSTSLATRILYSAVAAHKREPEMQSEANNIAAFQVTPVTREYITNVFEALFLPWGLYPDARVMASLTKLFKEHYSDSLLKKFEAAANLNNTLFASGFGSNEIDLSNIPKNAIFYGAGLRLRSLISIYEQSNNTFSFTIWDQNPLIKEINGHPVSVPDFETKARDGQMVIITVLNETVAAEVRAKLEPLGYKVYHGIESDAAYYKTTS